MKLVSQVEQTDGSRSNSNKETSNAAVVDTAFSRPGWTTWDIGEKGGALK